MPITPKPVIETEALTVRLPKELLELLDGYCRFLGGATDRTYVVAEALRHVVGRDRRYRRHREGTRAPSTRTTLSPSSSTN